MDDILAISGIAATAGITAGLAFGLRWILVDRDDSGALAGMLRDSTVHDWPVGVQEEEPFRWRVEALSHDRRGPVGDTGRAGRRAPTQSPPRTAPTQSSPRTA